LGLERAGMECVGHCEIEPYPRSILKQLWPDVPLWGDVRELKGEDIGPVELICGGFPCQPWSQAGQQRGESDDRDLWPEMFRIIKETRPTWVIGENVAGFIEMGLQRTLSNLEMEGYECLPFIIPACAVGAKHRRDRIFIVAHAESRKRGNVGQDIGAQRRKINPPDNPSGSIGRNDKPENREALANTKRVRLHGSKENRNSIKEQSICQNQSNHKNRVRRKADRCGAINGQWEIEPQLGRVADGVPNRTHRLKALGNAVVPQIPEVIGRMIMEIEK